MRSGRAYKIHRAGAGKGRSLDSTRNAGQWRAFPGQEARLRSKLATGRARAHAAERYRGSGEQLLRHSAGDGRAHAPEEEGAARRQLVVPRIGKQELHPTHIYAHKRGVVWCWRCGFYASARAERLAKPCMGRAPRGTAGWDYLARIRKGLTPKRAMSAWPLGDGASPPEGLVLTEDPG